MRKKKGKNGILLCLLAAGCMGCGINDSFLDKQTGKDFSKSGKRIAYVMPVAGEAELMLKDREKPVPSKGIIRIATIGSPYREILEEAEILLEKKGYDLEIEVCQNYDLPNEKVLAQEADGNFFQHSSYLERYNLEKDTALKEAAVIYFQPMAIYPGARGDLKEKKPNMKILVPEGITGFARALFLLQQEELLTLMEDTDFLATEGDIKGNPYELTLVRMKEEEIWSRRKEADFIISHMAYALAEGYHPENAALAMESKESPAAKAFGQGIVTVEGKEEKLKPLLEVLCSQEMKNYLNSDYKGIVQFAGGTLEETKKGKSKE